MYVDEMRVWLAENQPQKSSARKTPKVHLYEIDVKKYGFQNRKLILNTPLHSKWRQQTVMTIAQF